MRVFDGFDDIKSAVGSEIGASEWIEITQDRINRFAEATCDEQWIHVDQERVKKELPAAGRSPTASSRSAWRPCSFGPSSD
jgi:acyl dehydratase